MSRPATRGEGDLDGVRSELRRLGYLGHGVERLLLQDALRSRPPWRVLAGLTGRVAALGGLALALVLAFALAAANGNLAASPLDLLPLLLHLFPPLFAALALGFLALCGAVLLLLRLYPVRRIENLSLTAAVAAGSAALGLALWRGRELVAPAGEPLPTWQLAVFAVAAPAVAYVLVKLIYHGLLGLAIRLTAAAPGRRLFSRRGLGLALLSAAFLLTLPAVLAARRGAPAPPPVLPAAPGERVLLVGVDGVLPEEIDYLLALGDLPALGALARQGALLAYARRDEPPASFWTAVATGRPTPEHGVAALDSFRPLGVTTPLARNGPLRSWWSGVAVPLGLAEHRPLLANRRSAWAVWELAARGGAPVLAVDWWATFPAEPVPGLVVAHGGYQLLNEGSAGAVAPAAAGKDLAPLLAAAAASVPDARLAAASRAAAGVLDRALRPDLFYRQVFARRLWPPQGSQEAAPRAAALYLPGLDLAADGWAGGDVAFADLLRSELAATDALVADALVAGALVAGALEGLGTVAVVFDPGRRRTGGEGRVLLWRRGGCGLAVPAPAAGEPAAGEPAAGAPLAGEPPGGPRETIAPEAIAAGLLRALGLPQSRELPAPPAACPWPEPPATVAGYGAPRRPRPPSGQGGEYLESLRSLGYLSR